MEFRILGPVEVEVDGTLVTIAPKERVLLAVLVVSAGEVVSVQRLIHELWGSDPPADARNAVQLLVSRLRKALGPHGRQLLVTQRPGYVLQARSDEVDAQRFEALLRQAREVRAERPAEASLLLDEALRLWRGPVLAGLTDHDFARLEGVRLDELRVVATEEKIAADLELGDHDELVPRVRELVEQHRLRERLHGLLMLALYRAGRQSEALDVFRAARHLLADELGVDPGAQLQQLHERILRQDPELATPSATGPAQPAQHLPLRLTSFVGRDVEQRIVRKLLSTHRLVTVVGAGGVGKTSFAVEVGRQVQPSFPDGVWFVDLSVRREASFVARALADALGLAADGAAGPTDLDWTQRLCQLLRPRSLLVVMDNCEHLLDACATLTQRLLRACPDLRVLATSRERLGIAAETAWTLPPLGLPHDAHSPEDLRAQEAVRLFSDRAAAACGEFTLTPSTAETVGHICELLDGLPLAIELAAALARVLPLRDLATRLDDDRFRLLDAGSRSDEPRHRTLRAAIDWSYELLTPPECVMFRRLAVFPGSWTIDAADAVCDGDVPSGVDTLGLVSRLVEQSLVVLEGGDRAAYRMLETIRGYARERLVEAGELADVQRRHIDHVLQLAEAAAVAPASSGHIAALEAVSDDVAVAIQRAIRAEDRPTLLRLVGALGWYWATWRPREGRQHVHEAMAVGDFMPSRELGAALRASVLADSYTPTESTLVDGRHSIELCERFGDPVGAATSRLLLAFVERQLGGSCAEALALTDDAAAALGVHGDQWGQALAALTSFRLHLHCGALGRALVAGHDALRRFSTLGDPWGTPWSRIWLATASRMHGDTDVAIRLCQQALADADQRLPYVTCLAHVELAGLSALRGEHERALDHCDRARERAAASGVGDAAGVAANVAGFVARLSARTADARDHHFAAFAVFREVGSDIGVAQSLCGIGFAELGLTELDAARTHLREALRIAIRTRRLELVAAALEGLASTAVESDPWFAATLLGAARSTRDDTEIRVSLIEGDEPTVAERRLQVALGARGFARACRDGEQAGVEHLLERVADRG